MNITKIILGLLLLSFSSFGQTIIPQKSDTTEQSTLKYYGDGKKEEPKAEVEGKPEVQKDTSETKSVVIKYYEASESSKEIEPQKKPKDKNQIRTLTGRSGHSGGYGAITFKSSSFKGKTMVFGGARGGWIINRTVAIGVDLYGVIPTAKYSEVVQDTVAQVRVLGGYGGMFIEPIFFSNEVVHVTFPISAGAGWLGYHTSDDTDGWNNWEEDENLIDDDVFWYVEPGVNLEVNIARNFRIDLGVSRRFTQDLQLINTASDAFDGTNYYVTLKFGKF